jgi:hypothetical protein
MSSGVNDPCLLLFSMIFSNKYKQHQNSVGTISQLRGFCCFDVSHDGTTWTGFIWLSTRVEKTWGLVDMAMDLRLHELRGIFRLVMEILASESKFYAMN